jgi:hypothetical protein
MEDKNAQKPIEVPLRGRPRKRETDPEYFSCANVIQDYFEEKDVFNPRSLPAYGSSPMPKPEFATEGPYDSDIKTLLNFENRSPYSKAGLAGDLPRRGGFQGQGKEGSFYPRLGNGSSLLMYRADFDQSQKQLIDPTIHGLHAADGYCRQPELQKPIAHQALSSGFSYGYHEPMRFGCSFPKYPQGGDHPGGYGSTSAFSSLPPGSDFLEVEDLLQGRLPFKQEGMHEPLPPAQASRFQEFPQRQDPPADAYRDQEHHPDFLHLGSDASSTDYDRRMTASLFPGSGKAQWSPFHKGYSVAESLGHSGPWMNRKKRKNNPLLWQYIKTNQTFHPNVIHPSKYSSLDFIQGNDAGQKTYLGAIKRTPPEKDNSNSILPLFLSSNKEMTEDFKSVIQNFKSAFSALDFSNVTVHQLKNLMKEFGLNHTGKKNELIERLQNTLKKIDGREEEGARVLEKTEQKNNDDEFGYYFF